MPTAVIAQPISTAPASARAAMFCGRENPATNHRTDHQGDQRTKSQLLRRLRHS
jgi:hypothetical protein